MARSPAPSPERAALSAAHEAASAAQRALTEAEAAFSQALSAWSEASRDADGLETHLTRLQDRRDPGINQLRHEYAEQVDAARAALRAEEARIAPFKVAYAAARDRIPEAQRALAAAQDQVTIAARRVACAEATIAARACLARLQEAYAAMLEAGPDLLAAIDKGLLPPDLVNEAETAAGSLLRRATSNWPAYDARYRQSIWRIAVERLVEDPAAPLPQAGAS
jgi:chromosome segregation ATPase